MKGCLVGVGVSGDSCEGGSESDRGGGQGRMEGGPAVCQARD